MPSVIPSVAKRKEESQAFAITFAIRPIRHGGLLVNSSPKNRSDIGRDSALFEPVEAKSPKIYRLNESDGMTYGTRSLPNCIEHLML